LLAEDNLINQKLAVRLLQNMGHEVAVVNDGVQAVHQSEQGNFHLILMDMQMPVMGGLEATRLIRQRELGSATHQVIVAMTANAMQGDRDRCLEAGMDGYVSKPIDKNQLNEEIERVVVRAQSRLIWQATNLAAAAELESDSESQKTGSAPDDEAEDMLLPDLDIGQALERWDGDADLYLNVAQSFAQQCPAQLLMLRTAAANRDGKALIAAAHDMTGVAGNLSAIAIEAISRQILDAAKTRDFKTVSQCLRLLSPRLPRFEAALMSWANTLPH
jgi:CheY-like chemotaxis protein